MQGQKKKLEGSLSEKLNVLSNMFAESEEETVSTLKRGGCVCLSAYCAIKFMKRISLETGESITEEELYNYFSNLTKTAFDPVYIFVRGHHIVIKPGPLIKPEDVKKTFRLVSAVVAGNGFEEGEPALVSMSVSDFADRINDFFDGKFTAAYKISDFDKFMAVIESEYPGSYHVINEDESPEYVIAYPNGIGELVFAKVSKKTLKTVSVMHGGIAVISFESCNDNTT